MGNKEELQENIKSLGVNNDDSKFKATGEFGSIMMWSWIILGLLAAGGVMLYFMGVL